MPEVVRLEAPAYAANLFTPMRHKVLYGGRGGTKSWTVARALLAKGAERPLRILCTREHQNSIKDSVHHTLKSQVELLGYPYVITENEIRHPNGTVFIFRGLQANIKSIKSFEGIDIVWVEEAERVSKESWDTLLPTVRKAGSEIWVTFNPDLETDPVYQMFVVKPLPNTWALKVGAEDNPWFPKELVSLRAHAYATDPDAAAHVWGGETRKETAAQILRGKWIVKEFEPYTEEDALRDHGRFWERDPEVKAIVWHGPYYGSDFGFAEDPSACVKCWIAPGTMVIHGQRTERLMIEYESYKVGLELDRTADRWIEDVPGVQNHTLRADSARPESVSYLRRHGLPRIVGVHKWPGSVVDGIKHLRAFEQIVIHPRCKNWQAEAKAYSYKVDEHTGEILPVIVDRNNHLIDGTRYALAPRIKLRQRPQRKSIPGTVQYNTV